MRRLAALLIIALALPLTSLASPRPFCTELLTQELRDVVSAGRFETFRGLVDYVTVLGRGFGRQLDALTRKQRWIDMGAGHARAQKEYYLEKQPAWQALTRGKAELVAVAAEKPKEKLHSVLLDKLFGAPRGFKALYGRLVEDIPDDELGRADLITDVFGPLSYSDRPDLVLNTYLRILNAGGSIYVHAVATKTRIILRGGDSVDLLEWLSSLDGLRVERDTMSFKITTTRAGAQVPLLRLVDGNADVPPERIFKEL